MRLLTDFFVATGLAMIFLLLTWLWGRATSAGKPLNQFKSRLLVFSLLFALGMGYIMALFANVRWPRALLFPSIACWGALLGLVAWSRYRRQKRDSPVSER